MFAMRSTARRLATFSSTKGSSARRFMASSSKSSSSPSPSSSPSTTASSLSSFGSKSTIRSSTTRTASMDTFAAGGKSCLSGMTMRPALPASLSRSIVTRAAAMGMAGDSSLMSACLEALAAATGLADDGDEEDKPGHGRSGA